MTDVTSPDAPPSRHPDGAGTAALVAGVAALALALIPGATVATCLVAVGAVALGIVGMRRATRPSLPARWGLATGITAVPISLFATAAAFLAATNDVMPAA
jgi:hypothetical protein